MSSVKHKYVRHSVLGFVLWPDSADLWHVHVGREIERRVSTQTGGAVISAGFAFIGPLTVVCNGQSDTLGLKSLPDDSIALARQLGRVRHRGPGATASAPRGERMSAWMLTLGAREHHLSGFEIMTNQVDIRDVAHSLALLNRYTGHTTRPYSVAEHSLLVADLARRDGKPVHVQLACLMHDAHEAFTGDCASPAKQAIGLQWTAFEARQADIVRRQFGLMPTFSTYRQLITHYDLIALASERRDLTNFDARRNKPWMLLDTPGAEIPPVSPTALNLNDITRCNRSWRDWRDRFLEQFFALSRQVHAAEPTATE